MVDLERLQRRLVQSVRGTVSFDAATRARHATDDSGLHALPIGVVVAATDDDVRAALAIAHEMRCPVRARGHGLGWAGQCLGQALIIDATRVAGAQVEIDARRGVAVVHGGLAWHRVARALRAHDLECPADALVPDTGIPEQDPTVAGLVATGLIDADAAGGPSGDAVCGPGTVGAIDAWLADGSFQRFDAFGTHGGRALANDGERRRISSLFMLLASHHTDIVEQWPQVDGPVGGHGWDRLAQVAVKGRRRPAEADVNLAALLCGAQGRMAWIRHVTLAVEPVRRFGRLLIVTADSMPPLLDLLAMAPNVGAMRAASAAAVRTSMHWSMPRGDGAASRHALWIDLRAATSAAALDDAQQRWTEAVAMVRAAHHGTFPRVQRGTHDGANPALHIVDSQVQRDEAWRRHARWMRALLGPGRAGCVEVAVPAAQAARHWRELQALLAPRLEAHGLDAQVCGPARPGAWTMVVRSIDGRPPRLDAAIDVARRAADLAWRRHGSVIGPHGGGLARGLDESSRRALEAAQFGASLTQGFERMRHLFDGTAQFETSSELRGSLAEAIDLSIGHSMAH